MGVVNVTPDSFSDGGEWLDPAAAIAHGRELVAQGAAILDVGGESTRPGAEPVSEAEELRRVLPVLEGLAGAGARLSIDTSKAAVAAAALDAGATIVNDVTALRGDLAMAALVAERGCDCCLMHMLGEPRTMQRDPRYGDVVDDVKAFLAERLGTRSGTGSARTASGWIRGSASARRSTTTSSCSRVSTEIVALGRPVVVGTSRKSFLGVITGRDAQRARAGHDRDERARARGGREHLSRARRRRVARCPRGRGCYVGRAMGSGDDDLDEALDDDEFDDDDDRVQTVVTVEVNGLSLYTHHG